MHFVEVDGVRLFVETRGEGTPLVLIPGLGAGAWLWTGVARELGRRFMLVMPELRGSGRSDKPDHPYSIAQFAEDLRKILLTLGVSRAHLLGVSLGGFVAQHFAAHWPHMVERLVLVSTSLGGQQQTGPDGETLSRMIRPRGKTRLDRLRDAYPLNFTRDFMRSGAGTLDRITEWRTTYPQPEFAYYRQLLAGNAYDGARTASRIMIPTLVCAGQDDPLVPVDNARALAGAIPDSTLRIFAGKHLFFFEQPGEFIDLVCSFCLDGRRPESQPAVSRFSKNG